MNLPLDYNEPGYQMKVFTLCQSLTPISCKQGNYRFLTIELVKRQLIKARFNTADLFNLFLNERIRISDAKKYVYIYISCPPLLKFYIEFCLSEATCFCCFYRYEARPFE